MNRNLEKKIYECLGVNFFRKKILFAWEKIARILKIEVGYRIKKYNITSAKKYKQNALNFAKAHFFEMIGMVLAGAILKDLFFIIISIVLNGYCIMVQRYNIIRIDELVERMEKKHADRSNLDTRDLRSLDLSIERSIPKTTSTKSEATPMPKFSFVKNQTGRDSRGDEYGLPQDNSRKSVSR